MALDGQRVGAGAQTYRTLARAVFMQSASADDAMNTGHDACETEAKSIEELNRRTLRGLAVVDGLAD